jgi:hypothetical protein
MSSGSLVDLGERREAKAATERDRELLAVVHEIDASGGVGDAIVLANVGEPWVAMLHPKGGRWWVVSRAGDVRSSNHRYLGVDVVLSQEPFKSQLMLRGSFADIAVHPVLRGYRCNDAIGVVLLAARQSVSARFGGS